MKPTRRTANNQVLAVLAFAHVEGAEMEYELLGPLEVRRDGERLDLGPRKQRALLAVLLLEHGRAVSIDRIVDALWGDEPPARALASVQSYVSNLRRVVEPDRSGAPQVLVTAPPGYLLATDGPDVDLRCAEGTAARARDALEARSGRRRRSARPRRSSASAVRCWPTSPTSRGCSRGRSRPRSSGRRASRC